eukprot:794942_1
MSDPRLTWWSERCASAGMNANHLPNLENGTNTVQIGEQETCTRSPNYRTAVPSQLEHSRSADDPNTPRRVRNRKRNRPQQFVFFVNMDGSLMQNQLEETIQNLTGEHPETTVQRTGDKAYLRVSVRKKKSLMIMTESGSFFCQGKRVQSGVKFASPKKAHCSKNDTYFARVCTVCPNGMSHYSISAWEEH